MSGRRYIYKDGTHIKEKGRIKRPSSKFDLSSLDGSQKHIFPGEKQFMPSFYTNHSQAQVESDKFVNHFATEPSNPLVCNNYRYKNNFQLTACQDEGYGVFWKIRMKKGRHERPFRILSPENTTPVKK